MALINRIEVSCFLDSSQSEHRRVEEWQPDYTGVTFDVRGVNSIIAMENGYGKTSIAEAVLAVLSRDKELITRTRQRMAPKGYGAYSHIRVEILVQHNASQEDIFGRSGDAVPGEKHVLGIYGNCDGVDPITFYCYRGTLSDCPVAEWQGGLKVLMVPNQVFRNNIRSLLDAKRARNDLSVDEWKDEVTKYFEKAVIRQLVEYQKKGAGDVNAVFFKVSRRHGETFDSAFFYQHIAPELLVGVMGAEGEEDEYRFEQTVRISSLKVLEAMYSNRQEEKCLTDINKVVSELTEVSELGRALRENLNEYSALRKEFDTHAEIIKDIVIDSPLAGIPPSQLPTDPLAAKLASSGYLMLQNHEIYIIDKGLAEILGEETFRTNERAGRNSVQNEHCQVTEVLEIPCDTGSSASSRPQGGGTPNRIYTQSNASKLLSVSSIFAQGWDKETAIASLGQAFDWAETNIFRRKLRDLDREIVQYSEAADNAVREIRACEEQIKASEKDLEIIRDAQREYNKMVASGLFTDLEFTGPLKTRDKVEAELSGLKRELGDHQSRMARLEAGHKEYLAFVERCGTDADPRLMIAQLEGNRSATHARVQSSRQEFDRLSKELSGLYERRGNQVRLVERLAAQTDKIQNLKPFMDKFREIFGDASPVGLTDTVRKEYDSAVQERNALKTELASYAQFLLALASFRQKHAGSDPSEWLSERRRAWDFAKGEKMALEEVLNDKKKRRGDLDHLRIAPSKLYREAHTLIGGDVMQLYEAVESFGLDSHRRATVMTVFSNFLFAPVFDTVDLACVAARSLEKAKIEVPTFVLEELRDFCKNAEIGEVPGAAYSFFVGIRTSPVDCLLDPSLVAKEKKALDEEIVETEALISAANETLKNLDPQSADALEAQIALRALAERTEDKQMRSQVRLEEIEGGLPWLRSRRDADQHIRKAEEFVVLGGENALKQARLDYEEACRNEEAIRSQIESTSELQVKTKKALESAEDEYEKAMAGTDELVRLRQVSKFLFEDDGLTFMAGAEDKKQELESVQLHAERRNKFDFALAQNYVDYGTEKVSEIEALVGTFTDRRASHQNEARRCDDLIKTCRERKDAVLKDAIWLDEKASALINKYKEVKRVIDEVGFLAAEKEDVEKHPWLQRIKVFRSMDELDARSRELYSELCLDITAFSAVSSGSRIMEVRKKGDTARTKYCKAIDEVVSDKELELKDVEREYLSEAKTDVSKVEMMYEKLKAELEKRSAAYEITKKAVDDARGTLADRLDTFARRLRDNFDAFRKIAMFRKSEATDEQGVGFEVTATMRSAEEAQGMIEKIIHKIEVDIEERQKNRQDNVSIFDYGKGEYEAIDDYIRDTFYRFMFLEPKIRVYFPSMKSGHPFRFDPDHEKISLSQGQRVALSLLWIIKFAEFAIERESRMQTSSPAARRKLLAQKERVFIIDGLFSSLSSKALIKEALQSIAKIKGRFQLIGLVHNLNYQVDKEIFPTYYFAVKLMNPGERRGIVIVVDDNKIVAPEYSGRRAGEVVAMGLHYDRKRRPVRGGR